MTINFYLNNDTRSSKKDKAIFCYIRDSGNTLSLHTGERIEPVYWDDKKQKIRKSYIGSPELNEYLEIFKEKIKKIIRSAKMDEPFISFEQLGKLILKDVNTKNKIDFYKIFDLFIETRKPLVSKATTVKFTTIQNQIKSFAEQNKIDISFETIDLTFFDKIHNYYLSIGLSNNTIHKNMQFIKSFLRWSFEREYTKNNKFEDYKNIKLTETDNIALTKIDLNKIITCKTLNEKLQKVKDMFLFQLYTGQRYSDIANFKMSDVKNNIWYLRQTKTKKIIEIPLIEPAVKLLLKYKNSLPIITNQKMNEYLKELGEKADLKELVTVTKYRGAIKEEKQLFKYQLLTTHTARRTFVSLASYDGVNQQVVKAFTGHGTDKMVDKYFKRDNSKSRKIIEEIFTN